MSTANFTRCQITFLVGEWTVGVDYGSVERGKYTSNTVRWFGQMEDMQGGKFTKWVGK